MCVTARRVVVIVMHGGLIWLPRAPQEPAGKRYYYCASCVVLHPRATGSKQFYQGDGNPGSKPLPLVACGASQLYYRRPRGKFLASFRAAPETDFGISLTWRTARFASSQTLEH